MNIENCSIPLRLYRSRYCKLDDDHILTTTSRLNWPCYDVFGWSGKRKKVISDVGRGLIKKAIVALRIDEPMVGVIGVSKAGIDTAIIDVELTEEYDIGIH